ncbi:MAG: glycoside hydrolase family 15 protein [Defluviicoccus sp.]|nr:glycoside hydrolase family 15 protein [Defluviicoccus sp.]MDG4610085.1 glycoside hydrolase family 15 protein [Defluviicoccus sp.]
MSSPVDPAVIIQHPEIARLIADEDPFRHLDALWGLLDEAGTFCFQPLPTGLYAAAHLSARGGYTGYQYVWVRDSVHVAHALWRSGQPEPAVAALKALLAFFARPSQRERLMAIVDGRADPGPVENRPHIRFDGDRLAEADEPWSHAQNDALGYLLWLACRLTAAGLFTPNRDETAILVLLVRFFAAVRYWQDPDSGHWEEARKIEASSIGVVVAALRALEALVSDGRLSLLSEPSKARLDRLLPFLITQGQGALRHILPNESIERGHARAYDAALLFLIYPLDIIEPLCADAIIANVGRYLEGERGIRRYLLDSFWCKDYPEKVKQDQRTVDVSRDIGWRDALVSLGDEAQWCIFDPILSVIHGQRFLATGDLRARDRQVRHFHRALGQLTGSESGFDPLRCPELYYRAGEQWLPNDVTPLLWTQANLLLAFDAMRATARA